MGERIKVIFIGILATNSRPHKHSPPLAGVELKKNGSKSKL